MFTVKNEISKDKIAGLICTALEGGSNYWLEIDEYIEPNELWAWQDGNTYRHIQCPLSEGGGLKLLDNESGRTYTFNIQTIQYGLEILSNKFPKHYADFISGNDDANTGDSFLQCCLFGDIIYG